MPPDGPLIARKQRQARQRIITAANELFAARGFDAVSVSDIAERAEVGRTTFFRLFGDKQEVVFAREQELLDLIALEQVELHASRGTALHAGVAALEPVLLRLLEHMTADGPGYRQHVQLVESHPELTARDVLKMKAVAARLGDLLTAAGQPRSSAVLAAEVALACYWTARRIQPDPVGLLQATRSVFQQTLELGTPPRASSV